MKGYKTYIACAVGAGAVIANAFGFLSADQMNAVLGLAGFAGVAALRQAVTGATDKT